MSYRVKKHVYDSQTDQPAIRNASTGRRVCRLRVMHWWQEQTQADHVVLFSCARIPSIQTQLRVFHASHEEESDLFPFMEYVIQLQESMKKYLFHELPIENTPEINRNYRFIIVCPLCHRKLESGEIAEILEGDSLDASPRWDIMHMWQVNTPQEMERYVTSKLGSISAPVVPSAISNSRSTRRTIVYQSTSTMNRTTISHSSWSSSQQCLENWKSFQPPRTRKCKLSTTVFNSRTRWRSSAVLSDSLWHRHSEVTSICTCTPNNNYASTVSLEASNKVTNTSICWHARNPCSTVSSNRTSHWTIPSFLLANNALMIWRER